MRLLKLVLTTTLLTVLTAHASFGLSLYFREAGSWGNIGDPYAGRIKLNFVNFDDGVNYTITDTAVAYQSEAAIDAIAVQTPPTKAVAGEDGWGIFRLKSIEARIEGLLDTPTVWAPGATDPEITGMMWGGRDTYLWQTTAGSSVTQYIGQGGTGAFQDVAAHGAPNPIWMALWEDINLVSDWNPTLGPSARTNAGGALPGTVKPSYPGATEDPTGSLTHTPIWTFYSVPGFELPEWTTTDTVATDHTRDFLASYVVNTTTGDVSGGGGFYANASRTGDGISHPWGIGTMNDIIVPGAENGVDINLRFTNKTPQANFGWDVESNDPADVTVTPELSSASLMLLGLLPMGLVAWRRRKS
jgi:hypothetical protein